MMRVDRDLAISRALLLVLLALGLCGPAHAVAEPPTAVPARLAAIELAGSVRTLQLNARGRRLLATTVSYPSAGARRDELHLYDLGAEGAPAVTPSRRRFAIDESEAAALAPDGRHFMMAVMLLRATRKLDVLTHSPVRGGSR